jgi:hypothetical protein
MFDFKTFKRIEPTDVKAIDARIKQVVKHYNSKVAREYLHVALVACVDHAAGPGRNSADKLTNLYTSLPENANKRGLAIWIKEFTNLEFRKDKAGNRKFMMKAGDPAVVVLPGYDATPFYDMPEVKKDQDKVWDILAGFQIYIDKANKEIKAGKATPEQAEFVRLLSLKAMDVRETLKTWKPPVKEENNVIEMTAYEMTA